MSARHDVLEHAMEAMLALIRLHVSGCPHCANAICAGGMEELLRRIDVELREAAERVVRKPAPRGTARALRPAPRPRR